MLGWGDGSEDEAVATQVWGLVSPSLGRMDRCGSYLQSQYPGGRNRRVTRRSGHSWNWQAQSSVRDSASMTNVTEVEPLWQFWASTCTSTHLHPHTRKDACMCTHTSNTQICVCISICKCWLQSLYLMSLLTEKKTYKTGYGPLLFISVELL